MTVVPARKLSGTIRAPPSKAQTHRALFTGLLSKGETLLNNPLTCDDTEATSIAVSSLGAEVSKEQNRWLVRSDGNPKTPRNEIHCGESGVTLRFLIPIVSLTSGRTALQAHESLMRRPVKPLVDAMEQLGVGVITNLTGIVVEGGPARGGSVRIEGNISSQFVSGLLLAGPKMERGLQLEVISPLESRPYVAMTLESMRLHGVAVRVGDNMSCFEIEGGQNYASAQHQIAGDYSSAAFALAAGAITNSRIIVEGLSRNSTEPDAAILQMLSAMGTSVAFRGEDVEVRGGSLKANRFDIRESPDLGPIAAVLGCYADGQTRISGATRLRYKESDRLAAMTKELSSLGARITETSDGFVVDGRCQLNGGAVSSHGDHRIAMALAVAALGADDKVTIKDAECINKSYPDFYDDLRSLGAEIIG